MQVIAWDGYKRYLVSLDGDLETARKKTRPQGRVIDLNANRIYAPMNLLSIGSQGSWQHYTMTQSELDAILAQVEDRWAAEERERLEALSSQEQSLNDRS